MLSMIIFRLGTSGAIPAQDARPAPATTAAPSDQSVNGGKPQRVKTSAPRTTGDKEHWTDGMNTKRAPDPRKLDEYGAPKVTPPEGQGTDNPGGIPEKRENPPRSRNGVSGRD